MATVIYKTKINHEKKLIHNFTPKCGSSSISLWLSNFGQWENYNLNKNNIPNDYTVFSTVRNPIDWVISGFKMWKKKGVWFQFTQHLEFINNPYVFINNIDNKFDYSDWWYHCGITPDQHLVKNQKVFKIENIDKLQEWFAEFYPAADKVEIPKINTTSLDYNFNLTDSHHQYLINRKMYWYAKEIGYDIDFTAYL